MRPRTSIVPRSPCGWTLERRQIVPRPLEETFAFFADAGNLEEITPPFLHFGMLTPRPIAIERDTTLEYRLRLFGVPLRWRTRIEEWDPPRSFVDVQLRGPYAIWRHRHTFRAVDGGTEVHDRVDYDIPLGGLGRVAHALFVRRTLIEIFEFRARRLVDLLD